MDVGRLLLHKMVTMMQVLPGRHNAAGIWDPAKVALA
jgi:hypothetical protein